MKFTKVILTIFGTIIVCSILFLSTSNPSLAAFSGSDSVLMHDSGNSEIKRYFDAIEQAKQGQASMESWVGGVPKQYNGVTSNVLVSILDLTGYDPDFDPNQANKGAVGVLAGLIESTYTNPPASSVQYFADIGSRLGVGSQVYAQAKGGSGGFNTFTNFMALWKTFRDISYALMAIIFVLVGLAMMFRLKINPQTVISIQNAIPRLIIVLILITFSYAIAGLLVDLMFVVTNISITIINPSGVFNRAAAQGGILPFSLFFLNNGVIQAGVVSDIFNPAMMTAKGLGVTDPISTTLLRIFTHITPIGGPSAIVSFVLVLLVLYAFIKVLIVLLKAYVGVLIKVIFAPLMIMLGAFPGSNAGFGSWLRSIIADLAVFPAILVILMIASRITEIGGTNASGVLVPPMLGGIDDNTLAGLIGFGFLMVTPKAAEMVQAAMAGKPFAYGSAIGEAMGPLKTPAKFGVATGTNYAGNELVRTRGWGGAWQERAVKSIVEIINKGL